MSEVKKKQLLYMQLRDSILADYKDKPYYSPLPGSVNCAIFILSAGLQSERHLKSLRMKDVS